MDIAAIVAADLESSGGFVPMPRADMPSQPRAVSEINFADWRRVGMDNLVIGTLRPGIETDYQVEFRLVDVYKGTQLLAYKVPAKAAQLRLVAHQISDAIYEKLTGVKGAFATRIAYVTVQQRSGQSKIYRAASSRYRWGECTDRIRPTAAADVAGVVTGRAAC